MFDAPLRSVRPCVLAAALFTVILAAPRTCDAQFVALRVSWDDCTPPIVDRTTSLPGVNRLVVSATGLTPGVTSAQFVFTFYPYFVVPAWQFFPEDPFLRTSGCEGPARLTFDQAGTSCPAYPLSSADVRMVQSEFALTSPSRTVLRATLGLDPGATPNPAQRYTLVRFLFDQANAVAGSGDGVPGACGGYDLPMCIAMGATLGRIDQMPVAIAFDQQFVTWQDASNTSGCPLAVPARAKTWGQIKNSYR